MHDSPKHPRSRLAESVASASDFVSGKKRKDGTIGKRRLVAFVVVVIGLLALGERSWNGESVLSRGRRMEEFSGLRKLKNGQEGTMNQQGRTPSEDGRNRQGLGLGRQEDAKKPERWVKVSKTSRVDTARPEPNTLSSLAVPALDPSQRFIFVGWMGEQVHRFPVLRKCESS
jgi:hypothetical protein